MSKVSNSMSYSTIPPRNKLTNILLSTRCRSIPGMAALSHLQNKHTLSSTSRNRRAKPKSNDYPSIILLIILYFLQGVPTGLVSQTIPLILKSSQDGSYSEIGVFLIALYPYSLKLLWSPVVDACYSWKMGRRKSWVVPIQLIMGCMFIYLGYNAEKMFDPKSLSIPWITFSYGFFVLLCATQDIAVDGWALTMVSEENKRFASSAQTIGLGLGSTLSSSVFLAFNSPEFCNRFIRSSPLPYGIVQLSSFLITCGIACLLVTLFVLFFVKEKASDESVEGIVQAYHTMHKIITLPYMPLLISVLLISRIGFTATESTMMLKLIEKGFNQNDLALVSVIDFPLQMIFGYYTAKWSHGNRPLKPWLNACIGRTLLAVITCTMVFGFSSNHLAVIGCVILSSFLSNVMFVSQGAFFSRISDVTVGGTYMTLLNAIANFGGTWPRFFALEGVDYFTHAECTVKHQGNIIRCANQTGKQICANLQGTCYYYSDGFYVVSAISIVCGLVLFVLYIDSSVRRLESVPIGGWKVAKNNKL